MKHAIGFPNYIMTGPAAITKRFDSYRAWLEENIGVQGKDWDWITGDIHARGLLLPTKRDITAFKLKFEHVLS